MKKPKLAVLPYRHDLKYKFVLDLRAFGRGRKFFKTRAEAEAERRRQLTALERHGREAIGLPQHEVSDFIRARKTLAEYGKTITDATAFYVDHLERVRRCKTTVAQLVAELIKAKRKDGRSGIYLRDLRNLLAIFSRDFADRPIAGITVEELDNWLRALPGSPKTRTNFRTNVGVLFSYAARRRMIDTNPVLHTAKPKLPDNPPEIFTVNELRALLEAANRGAPDVVPMLTIGAFAGLRDAEIKKLDWSEVDLSRGHIEVKAVKAAHDGALFRSSRILLSGFALLAV
jgi:integrase